LTLTQGQGSSMGRMNTPTKHATGPVVTPGTVVAAGPLVAAGTVVTAGAAVIATGLRKVYGDKVVLDDVDLSIGEGEVFALLGPNGAGKTTTVHILSTLIPADAGTATVLSHDVRSEADAVRAGIGVTGQFSAVDKLLTGEENLLLMGRLLHLPAAERRTRAAQLLERFELVDAAQQTPATYSGGMQRRLDIAMTLMGRPRLIFLDEPTTGLDPRSRHTTWQLIRDLVADGVTILLTTQYLEEADQLADRIAVLDHGRIVAQGTPEELKRRVPGAHIELRFGDAASLGAAARALSDSTRDDEQLILRVPHEGSVRSLRDVLARLGDGVSVADLSIHTPDLDDVFFALTGGPAKEQTQ
jgi:ABC-2 type transport system ATP-binding protein